jgi:peroxiredoxin
VEAVAGVSPGDYRLLVLRPGDEAPDFTVGKTTLHGILEKSGVVVFFFPKAFTPG